MQRSGDYLLKISYFSGQMNTDVSFFRTGGIKMYVQLPGYMTVRYNRKKQTSRADKQSRNRYCPVPGEQLVPLILIFVIKDR
ncbi:Uncharacterised protein [Klebsiella pneumoniae]|nr:Uncharacterised protein [Klebsiella pneumoniae]